MLNRRFGPYDVVETLGQGGMGTVYEARDQSTGESVAVKVLAPNSAEDEQLRGRFATEIETLKKLEHPNIVGIIGYGEQDGALYFSMELVDGKSLFDELRSGRRFHWTEVVRMGIDIGEALRHAHDRGVIHRDLKPGNLLLDQDGNVKLTDFGIAKLFGGEQRTAHGGVIGTAEYMSPEQAQGLPVTLRSDLYSLGSVLYALLARRPPFESSSLPEAIKNVTSEKPAPIRDVVPNVPPELAQLIDRLLEKRPEDRIGTAQSVTNRLKSISVDVKDEDVDFVATPSDDEIAIDERPQFDLPDDPDKTDVPDTVKAKRVTAGAPRPPRRPIEKIPPSFVSTEVPPTVIQGQTSDSLQEAPFAPQPPQGDKFQVVDEEERRSAEQVSTESSPQGPVWPYAIALLLLLTTGVVGLVISNSPKSADTLYKEIQAASDDGTDQLARMENEMAEFVDRFADDERAEEVDQYLTFVRSSKYPRRLEQQARLRGGDSLSACQRDYLAALRTADVDPEEAVRKMETLLVIYGDLENAPEDVKQCVESARLQLRHLRGVVDQYIQDHQAIINNCLSRVGELRKSEPRAARRMLRGLIQRYGDSSWAADAIDEAQRMIKMIDTDFDSPKPPDEAAR